MNETQASISKWAEETFGAAGSTARVAARANEEMAELLRALTIDDDHPKATEEVADIYIVLCRVATRLGVDIQSEVDRKMAVNRNRAWKLDGSGHGYHAKRRSKMAIIWIDSPVTCPDWAHLWDYTGRCQRCGQRKLKEQAE